MRDMDIAIRNFVGVARADILGLDKIALVAGRNASGKTSILQAIAAVMCADPLVRGINTQKSGGSLVRAGADAAKCLIKNGDAQAMMTWPAGKYEAKGKLEANPYACGLKHVAELDDKERTKVMIELLGAKPGRDDVAKFLADHFDPVNDAMVDKIWNAVREKGWDVYFKQLKERGAMHKGKWEEITGENYGLKRAEEWVPEGWDETLTKSSEDTLNANVVQARSLLEGLLRNAGAASGRKEELEAVVAQQEEAQEEKAAHQANLDLLQESLEDLIKKHRAIEVPPMQEPFPCPHCNELLHFGANVGSDEPVVKAEKIADQSGKVKKARDGKIQLDHNITAKRREIREATEKITECQLKITQAHNARAEIAKIEKGGTPQEEIDLQRADVDAAVARLTMHKTWTRATTTQRAIATNVKVQQGVRPEGIRRTVLQAKLKDFNEVLKDLSNRMKLEQPVMVDEEITIRLGLREYARLSTSERIRVNLIIELALAQLTKAPLIVFDDFDTIEPQGRPPIFHVIRYVNIPCVIGIMAKGSDAIPDISKKGLQMGTTYWLEDAELLKVTNQEE